ncbi:hypothetical protein K7432_007114 [Basidiobolus ranarum]|uniref:Polysaccharide lyase 14 domain-containing protein n=1 Tax=Basidiobolus ranarum TaxID=34480 RepID=A0ABR2WU12_9FUNG
MITCNDVYGQSIGRGFDFNKGAWNRVALYIQVNTIGKEDGIIQLYLNDTLWLDIREIPFRKEKGIGISSIMFSTFFGGNTPDYATPADTYTYYKNIRLSVGDPIALFDANASNASTTLLPPYDTDIKLFQEKTTLGWMEIPWKLTTTR